MCGLAVFVKIKIGSVQPGTIARHASRRWSDIFMRHAGCPAHLVLPERAAILFGHGAWQATSFVEINIAVEFGGGNRKVFELRRGEVGVVVFGKQKVG